VPLANRATIGNMSPEFGSTAAMFPIDEVTLDYLRLTGRSAEQIALVEAYSKEQGLWHDPSIEPRYSEYMELDLQTVVPSIAGPRRPQDRIALDHAQDQFHKDLEGFLSKETATAGVPVSVGGANFELENGAVTIAAITSCTNTSNPSVMLAAGLLARNAAKKGLKSKPWVKTTLAPGSKVVTDYYEKAGLMDDLEALGFYLVGYGCTTCIGNSGPLADEISQAINDNDLAVTAVLSGNRNFEGRINPDVKMNYLASPPLVIAYALAGTMDFDFDAQPLGQDQQGNDVFLADVWPDAAEVQATIDSSIDTDMFLKQYASVFDGDDRWRSLPTPTGDTFEWDDASTYVRKPPYFEGMTKAPLPVTDIAGARVLALLGDSVTTDHISPAGSIKADSPAGRYLSDRGIDRLDFNSYGSRRGNHEVMIRGTFANIRLKNLLLDGVEGGFTRDFTTGEGQQSTIYDASERYGAEGTPLVILAGKEYGSGSSRDWAAKGTSLLGVRAVIAESFERIHRSNLIGMGVIPLQFPAGQNAASLGLDGTEEFSIEGIVALNDGPVPATLRVSANPTAHSAAGKAPVTFDAVVRIDTPAEADYYRNGGILQYVLRSLL
jgi:aconitate hydratase